MSAAGDFAWSHRHADLPGARIHYVRHGSGRPVVLCHGYPEFWYIYHRNYCPLLHDIAINTVLTCHEVTSPPK